ncbi:hypothetical protein BV25DRAFT_1839124 [Artomyces pyxidatus]|uniref:Uncharacterized protein n=1 Tax=Artomyces pyxidatus TaxID=48021 RepID=A0ACB8SY53_9AGAM|nr:hypothetical protein BV25DRAFT_1839124 [Artomyces pyxidatus]
MARTKLFMWPDEVEPQPRRPVSPKPQVKREEDEHPALESEESEEEIDELADDVDEPEGDDHESRETPPVRADATKEGWEEERRRRWEERVATRRATERAEMPVPKVQRRKAPVRPPRPMATPPPPPKVETAPTPPARPMIWAPVMVPRSRSPPETGKAPVARGVRRFVEHCARPRRRASSGKPTGKHRPLGGAAPVPAVPQMSNLVSSLLAPAHAHASTSASPKKEQPSVRQVEPIHRKVEPAHRAAEPGHRKAQHTHRQPQPSVHPKARSHSPATRTVRKRRLSLPLSEKLALATCVQCNKTFNRPADLRRHLERTRVHEGVKYICERCGTVLTRHDAVLRHQKLTGKCEEKAKWKRSLQAAKREPSDATLLGSDGGREEGEVLEKEIWADVPDPAMGEGEYEKHEIVHDVNIPQ